MLIAECANVGLVKRYKYDRNSQGWCRCGYLRGDIENGAECSNYFWFKNAG